MSIASEITRLNNAKAAIKQSLTNKGVEVSDSALLDEYPALIDSIPMEGGNPYYEDLYNLKTNNGTDMTGLFAYCTASELDLRSLDTSKATSMSHMFDNCSSSVNTEGWDTSNVKNMSNMFNYFSGSIDISQLDTSNVTNAIYMFNYANTDNIILTGLSFPKCTKLDNMFSSTKGTTLDLSSWDISNITSLYNMFSSTNYKKIDLTGWKTTNVTDMNGTFTTYSNPLVELIIPDWDMTNCSHNIFNKSSYIPNLKLIDLSRSNDATITKIASFLPTRTATTYGRVLVPANTSQAALDTLIAKYWKPVGADLMPQPTSIEVVSELDEVYPNKTTKVYIGASEPWYADTSNVELFLPDESLATLDEDGVLTVGFTVGNVVVQVRFIDTQEVVGTKTIVVSETDSYPNLIKFRVASTPNSSSTIITVNGSGKKLSNLTYDSITDIYSYDAGAPITSIKFNSSYCDISELIKLNTSNITSMNNMFNSCSSLTQLDLSNFNTSNVTNMEKMFYNCSSLTSLDISNFDMTNVTSHMSMFGNCTSLHTLRLDNCNNDTISKIINSLLFPTNAIEGVTRTIYCKEENAAGLVAPTNWVFSYITEEEPEEPDIPLYVSGQFSNNTEITEVRTMVNDTHTDLANMFNSCINLTTINTTDWDTSNVTDMSYMFNYCHKLTTLDLSSFDTSKVTNTGSMFNYCSNLEELDLRNFDISNTTNVNVMFGSCYELRTLRLDNCSNTTIKKIITSTTFPTGTVNGITRKIYCKQENITGLTAPNGWVFVDYMTGEEIIPEMPDVPLYVSGQFSNKGDITEVETMVNDTHTDLANMFCNCFNLASIIGIEDWDTSNVTSMNHMFRYCHKLITLDLSNFNTSKVTEMYCMFMNCSNLTTVDLSNFDMTNVTSLMGMFGECYELHTLRLDNCNNTTISKIVTSAGLPTGTVNGTTRKIYCKEENAAGLTPPTNWEFVFVD